MMMYAAVENTSGNVPAFLIKLWTLVEDPQTDHLIQWDVGGTSFHVYDQQSFSREILPLYFKHNNIASFVRQLNMYGFRKVTTIDQGGLKIEKDDLQFQHQFFQRGDQDLLQYIKRKVSNQAMKPEGLTTTKPEEFSRVLTEMNQVKTNQDSMDKNLEYIKRENKLLWREVAVLQQKHHKQQQIVNKLIQFLVSLVNTNRTGLTIPPMRRMPLAISDVRKLSTTPATGTPITDSIIQQSQVPTGSTDSQIRTGDLVPQTSGNTSYTIESPKMQNFVLSPTPSNSSGPIIQELAESPKQILVNFNPQNQGTSQRVIIQGTDDKSKNVIVVPQLDPNNANDGGLLMSPIIEEAPSFQDALKCGLNVPSSSSTKCNPIATSLLPPVPVLTGPGVTQQKRKRKSDAPDSSTTPSKVIAGSGKGMKVLVADPLKVKHETEQVGQSSLALTPAKESEEFDFSIDQLDHLTSDLDGVKNILQEQYKLDPTFLMELELLNGNQCELFDSANPWPLIPDDNKDTLELLNAQADNEESAAGSSGSDIGNILGNELVEYNNRVSDDLFPELMNNSVMANIDDID